MAAVNPCATSKRSRQIVASDGLPLSGVTVPRREQCHVRALRLEGFISHVVTTGRADQSVFVFGGSSGLATAVYVEWAAVAAPSATRAPATRMHRAGGRMRRTGGRPARSGDHPCAGDYLSDRTQLMRVLSRVDLGSDGLVTLEDCRSLSVRVLALAELAAACLVGSTQPDELASARAPRHSYLPVHGTQRPRS